MEKKVKAAVAAIVEEKKDIEEEEHAEEESAKDTDKIDAKKVKEESHYPTNPAQDVEIISSKLHHECAGNYQMSNGENAITIHDHPVWIKVKPHRNRAGYY